ncbi:MAG: SDR family NAD(P)-dependent oxidoreductase [Phycisphaerales bacterium JB058]
MLAGIDLSGRCALVTGASVGIGAETARAPAAAGAAVTITARERSKGEAVAEQIRSAHDADVEVRALELAEQASVRAFAKEFLADHAELHMLVNNAGMMRCPLMDTAEGWELQFATNHLWHFLLTNRLAPALLAGAPSRMLSVSSSGHTAGNVDFDDIHFERYDYNHWQGYGPSKTANVLFAVELDRRLHDLGVRAFSLHPGYSTSIRSEPTWVAT